MLIFFAAYDSNGATLHTSVERVPNWTEACRLGMDRRNQLVGDGIRVTWVKYR